MKQQEKTRRTRERILDAAVREFGEKGYFGASLSAVCAAGIPKGLLYHNFENKDALYTACLSRCFEKLTLALKEAGPELDLQGYMDVRLRFFRENEGEERLFFEALLDPPAHLREAVSALKQELDSLNLALYSRVLSRLTLRQGITEQEAADYFTLVQTAFNLYFSGPRFSGMPIDRRAEAHERMLPKLINCMLYGVAEGGERL